MAAHVNLKPNVYLAATNIFSPLGETTAQNFEQVKNGVSAIQIYDRPEISEVPIAASLFNEYRFRFTDINGYTRFEQMLIFSIRDALGHTDVDPKSPDTGLIISTTKGNIRLIETWDITPVIKERISLGGSAKGIAMNLHFKAQPIVVSNACISGVMALITGMRLIQSGVFKNVVVAGADEVSKFVTSGFQSFQALSSERCKPFDKNRTGLNLGEGAATIILSGDEKYADNIRITGGAISDDANHISGPSRTGEELAWAIEQAIKTAGLNASDMDMISAHGTATSYNDDMEAKAISLAGLKDVPIVAAKGHYGHTLGAAGLIESVITAESIRQGLITSTLGFEETGTTAVNVNIQNRKLTINHALKTASGFGGCNGALILSK